jgi:putative DNA primase/helicase
VASGLRTQLFAHTEGSPPAFVRPALIEQLNDRQNDIVEPLMAIANLAGGTWPEKARAALLELFTTDAEEYQNTGTQLLADIRDIFDEAGFEGIQTKGLIRQLREREESPWSDYHHGKALTANALARILKPYKIQTQVWWEVGRTVRGYQRRDFEDAWSRYLPQRTSASSGLPTSRNGRGKVRMAGTSNREIEKGKKHLGVINRVKKEK